MIGSIHLAEAVAIVAVLVVVAVPVVVPASVVVAAAVEAQAAHPQAVLVAAMVVVLADAAGQEAADEERHINCYYVCNLHIYLYVSVCVTVVCINLDTKP